MTERAWPTVPEILARARVVHMPRYLLSDRRSARYVDAAGRIVTIHRATLLNLLNALESAGWKKSAAIGRDTAYERPTPEKGAPPQ